ncbi:hypothetical protein C3420_16930 [Acinetobacter sp. ACNIH3]|nr:hypothetical protein C3420_16930 [Acinetobacter sp. ACNIH3]POV71733.1 hypothetical protein C3421_16710 [Acinetobacter sp. ACNIH4]
MPWQAISLSCSELILAQLITLLIIIMRFIMKTSNAKFFNKLALITTVAIAAGTGISAQG